MSERFNHNSPITLIEVTPRSFGKLCNPEFPDAYGVKDFPPRALGIIHAVTEQAGFTDVRSIAPAFNRSRLVLPFFSRHNREFTDEDWRKMKGSAIVAACSALSANVDVSLEVLQRVKKMNSEVLTAIGGYDPTFDPEYCLERGADLVVMGEGYVTWPAVLTALLTRGTYEGELGIAYKKNGKIIREKQRPLLTEAKLSTLPLPVHDKKVLKSRSRCVVESSYGCTGKCAFCSVWQFNGGKHRTRSIESTITELKTLPKNIQKYWRDENFAADEEKTAALLETSINSGLTPLGTVSNRVEAALNRELVKLYKRAGIGQVCLGIESPNPDALEEMHKGTSLEQVEQAVAIYSEAGIDVYGMFIFGWDADTPASIQKTVDWAIKRVPYAQFFIRTPGSKTMDTLKLRREGRLLTEKYQTGPRKYLANGLYVLFEPNNFSPYELQMTIPDAYLRFYSEKGSAQNRLYARYAVNRVLDDPQSVAHYAFLKSIESPKVYPSAAILSQA